MKKIIVIACVVMASMTLIAQDIIITNDAQKIEAKILEVSKTEIKYKENDNLDGPTFILETKEVSSVIYSNGKVVLYNKESATIDSTPSKKAAEEEKTTQILKQIDEQKISAVQTNYKDTVEILLLSGETVIAPIIKMNSNNVSCIINGKEDVIPASKIEKVTFLANGQVREYHGYSPSTSTISANNSKPKEPTYKCVTRSGNTYYYDGRSMRGNDYASFLSKNCQAAYAQYNSGHKAAIAGWILFGVGLGIDLGFSWWVPYSWIPALGLEIACIPTLAVGYSKMHRSVDVFNSSCVNKKPVAYWSINASQNGIGIAYNF